MIFFTRLVQIVITVITLLCASITASAQSPYAMFGDKSVMLDAKKDLVNNMYRVKFRSTNDVKYFADFDLGNGLVTLSDLMGNVIHRDSISEDAKAIFTT